ncbi:MAG TPA: tetratricopeptide repeat protein [Burkholderiales bacterium]|nr:tetratricopeptide repeat protein [Burkholderiales bacterium]
MKYRADKPGPIQRAPCMMIAAALVVACVACTPAQSLLFSLVPDGTIPVLLSHFQSVSDVNRRRIAEFEQRRDWDGLAKFAEENLKQDKSNSEWWLIAGYAYSQADQRKRAIECYAEVVRLAPEDMLGWNLLAQSYRLTGQADRSLQVLNRALAVRRDVPETWFLLGETYSELGRLEPAVSAYREALQLDDQFAYAWLGLGKVYVHLGRDSEVRRVAQVLDKLNPALAKELAAFKVK